VELHDVYCACDKVKKGNIWGWGFWQVRREEMCVEGFVVKPEGKRPLGKMGRYGQY